MLWYLKACLHYHQLFFSSSYQKRDAHQVTLHLWEVEFLQCFLYDSLWAYSQHVVYFVYFYVSGTLIPPWDRKWQGKYLKCITNLGNYNGQEHMQHETIKQKNLKKKNKRYKIIICTSLLPVKQGIINILVYTRNVQFWP